MSYTAYDGVGNVKTYQASVYVGTPYTNYYSYEYAKYDGYREKKVNGSSSYFLPGATTVTYDVNGAAIAVSETFRTSKNRSFVVDSSGRILRKNENGKTQHYFYANDKPVGSSGALAAADFDYNYTPVSEQYPAVAPGNYVVSAGDTLRGIALAVYGDAQLWYLIADANGLQTDAELTVGSNLTIPNKITNLRNAYDTYKPYEPGKIIGDLTPTLPNPPPPPAKHHGGGGCGGIGRILVAVVAIVVAAVVAPYLTPYISEIAAGAVAGALGSVASQVVGNVLGVQDGFSWKAVAMGAIGGGVSAGLGMQGSPLHGTDPGIVIARAMVSNALTQGVGVAVGLQDKFDWKGVAAAGISAGVSYAVGEAIGQSQYDDEWASVRNDPIRLSADAGNTFGRNLVSGLAGGIAKQVVYGGKANWASVIGDAFGNALGNSMAYAATAGNSAAQQAQSLESALKDAFKNSSIDWKKGIQVADAGGVVTDALSQTEQSVQIAQGQLSQNEPQLTEGSATIDNLVLDADPDKLIDPTRPGLYKVVNVMGEWVVTGATATVETDKAAINGILNEPGYAAYLMGKHIEAEFGKDITEFTLFYNPTDGFIADSWESLRDKLGFTTEVTKQFSDVLKQIQNNGRQVDWVAHSQAGIIFSEGVRVSNTDLSNNSVAFHSGGNNQWVTNSIMEEGNVRIIGYRDHPFDPVPNIAGFNTINPVSIIGSIFALPFVIWGGPKLSPHTLPYVKETK